MLITAVTLMMFPESWIYFGILHFMLIASLLTFALIGKPKITLSIGIVILLSYWVGWVPYGWPLNLIPGLPTYTEDFVSPFPWLGVACIGLSLGEQLKKYNVVLDRFSSWEIGGGLGKTISFAGKRSLSIYMLHQPILFTLIFLTGYLIHLVSA